MGDQGYSAIEILRNFYGDNMYINTAEEISGIPASWPGQPLDIGSSGSKVRQIQEQLNAISKAYPALPSVTADGIYGEATQNAVREFQRIFGLPATGVVDYPTWYEIQDIYVGVTRNAELVLKFTLKTQNRHTETYSLKKSVTLSVCLFNLSFLPFTAVFFPTAKRPPLPSQHLLFSLPA